MPYVVRNSAGIVVNMSSLPVVDSQIWLEDSHPDVQAFLQKQRLVEQARQGLTNTDLDMIRIIEDLVELLMSKNVFIFTELPQQVQDKLGSRKQLRKELHSLSNLMANDDGIF